MTANARRPERAGQHKPGEQQTRDFSRVAQTRAASWNPDQRTIEVAWTAHGDVRRYDYQRDVEYIERLSTDPAHWNLSRLNNGGGPVLNSHSSWDLRDQIGVVVAGSASVTPDGGTALVRLSDAPGDVDTTRKIATGICRNLSFGYEPSGWVKSIAEDGVTEIRTATAIEVYELSFTPIPADAGAMSRSRGQREGRKMSERQAMDADQASAVGSACASAAAALSVCATACDSGDANAAAAAKPICEAAITAAIEAIGDANAVVTAALTACAEVLRTGDDEACSDACEASAATCLACVADAQEDAAEAGAGAGVGEMSGDAEAARAAEELRMNAEERAKIVKEERERAAGINLAARKLGIPQARADELIADTTVSLEAARTKLFDESADASERSQPVRAQSSVSVVREHGDQVRAGMESALLHRIDPRAFPLDDAGKAHRNMRIGEMARALASHDTRGLSERDVLEGVFKRSSTSDFPLLLDNVLNKTLQAPYESLNPVYPKIARQVSATDLKRRYPTILSGAADFSVIPEGADYPIAILKEGRESYVPVKRGMMIALTLEALINDDLSGFDRVPREFVVACERTRDKAVIALLTANAAMADGFSLFDGANHANTVTGAAVTPAQIDLLMKLIDLQTGANGEEINLEGQILLFPRALQQTVEQLYAIRTSPGVAVTASSGILTDRQAGYGLVASRFLDSNSTKAFYALANPSIHAALEYATLAGRERVTVERDEWFSNDTIRWKATDFFGCAPVDYRAIARSDNF